MKTLAKMVLILGAGLISPAKDSNKIPVVLASVRYNPGMPPAETLCRAEGIASGMFAKTGVQVQVIWHAGRPPGKRGEMPILIDITLNTPEAFHRGALAYSQIFEDAHITIFWDRLRGTPDSAVRTGLLAHVLVHEIAHILQGTNHHSREGIMKMQWTSEDILQMVRTPLSFAPEDVKLIRLGLAARSSVR